MTLGLVNQGANLRFPACCTWGERNISPNPASKIPPLLILDAFFNLQKVTEFNPDELASPATLQIPSDRREEKLESIDEQSIFVRAYVAGRRALGIKDNWQDYDYSYLQKPKDSEE